MIDIWTKQSPKGKTVRFKIEGDKKTGFVYSAETQGGDIVQVDGSLEELTREQVEARFAEFVAVK